MLPSPKGKPNVACKSQAGPSPSASDRLPRSSPGSKFYARRVSKLINRQTSHCCSRSYGIAAPGEFFTEASNTSPFSDQTAAIMAAVKQAKAKRQDGTAVEVRLNRTDGVVVVQSLDDETPEPAAFQAECQPG